MASLSLRSRGRVDDLASRFCLPIIFVLLGMPIMGSTPRPANDDFANRIELMGNNLTFTGTVAGATTEYLPNFGDEMILSGCFGRNVWWSWTATETSIVFLESLDVIPLDNNNYYSCMEIVSLSSDYQRGFPVVTNPAAPGRIFFIQSLFVRWQYAGAYCLFPATNGCTYYFQLAAWAPAPTNLLRFHLVAGTLPVIIDQPANLTVSSTRSALFTVAAASVPPFSFQWQFNGVD